MLSPTGRPPEKRARDYFADVSNEHASFGVGSVPVKMGRPPELEDPGPGCVGTIGCGSSQAKKIS